MGTRGRIAIAALALTALFPQAAHAAHFKVGAARVSTTPPAYAVSQDAGAFTGCNAATYNGPRQFAFEEPYTDTDGSGDFSFPASQGGLVPEPYCDANGNGRWDGIWLSGGVAHLAKDVHDPLDARAVAISDGTRTVVVVSVVAQGIFQNYIERMRSEAQAKRPGITDVIVSANHNESSPDTIGIYGAPQAPDDLPVVGGAVGLTSGIDDYYMNYLVDRVAAAAARAYDHLRPATLWERDFAVPDNVDVHLSKNFPTTNDDGSAAAVDPKIRVLQARAAGGKPIATVMNLAAHNQEIGHSGDPALQDDLSSDWPGYFATRLEHDLGGMGMFLVGDNGSEEDPRSVPAVPDNPTHDCPDGCYAQAKATGVALAEDVAGEVPAATKLRAGRVSSHRDVFFIPLENNLFVAAAGLGLFGERSLYTAGLPTGHVGQDLRSEVGVVGAGPDLQMIANPGEAFPALMVGSPWGMDEASCPERPNPPVPAWHAKATHRLELGLADDMIGYQSPAWAFTSLPGALDYNGVPATCFDDTDDVDPQGHQHKLETEGAGPSAGNLVAQHLTAILDKHPDPLAHIRLGRFVYADGSLSRRAELPKAGGGAKHAVAIWLAKKGTTALTPGTGRIVALKDVRSFGARKVRWHGEFMDYDGAAQPGADITTRGMQATRRGRLRYRYYLNVYPALDETPLGPAGK